MGLRMWDGGITAAVTAIVRIARPTMGIVMAVGITVTTTAMAANLAGIMVTVGIKNEAYIAGSTLHKAKYWL